MFSVFVNGCRALRRQGFLGDEKRWHLEGRFCFLFLLSLCLEAFFFLIHSLSLPLPCSFSFPFSACLSLRYLSVSLFLFPPFLLSLFLPLSLANILSFDFAYVFQIIMQLSRRSANSSFQGAISLCQVCLVLFRIIIMQYLIKVSEWYTEHRRRVSQELH